MGSDSEHSSASDTSSASEFGDDYRNEGDDDAGNGAAGGAFDAESEDDVPLAQRIADRTIVPNTELFPEYDSDEPLMPRELDSQLTQISQAATQAANAPARPRRK